jgi:hypothetical protein
MNGQTRAVLAGVLTLLGVSVLAVLAAPLLLSEPARPSWSLAHRGLALPEACRASGVAYPPPEPRVLIRKEARALGLYSGATLVKEYRVALGPDPLPDKEREGDGRTPLGEFYLCTRLERSRFHRFLGLSYPAPEDALRGLDSRLVNRFQYRAILAAHARKRLPPWNTPLGGAIGIHGGGSGSDWTAGCIALEDGDIEELFQVLPLGAPVHIER